MIQVSSLTIQIAITGKVDMGEGAIGMVNEFIIDLISHLKLSKN